MSIEIMSPYFLFKIIFVILFIQSQCSSARLCGKFWKSGKSVDVLLGQSSQDGMAKLNFLDRELGSGKAQPGCGFEFGETIIQENTNGTQVDQKVSQLCCTCDTMACEMVELHDECARLFGSKQCITCYVQGHNVYPGESNQNFQSEKLFEMRKIPGKGVLSAVVNYGCKLTMYENINFGGNWRIFYNGFYTSLGNGGANPVGSYKCECANKLQVSEWITLVTGNENGTSHGNETIQLSQPNGQTDI